MSKKISRFLSLLLAAVMTLSMAMTGLAATITINNSSEGEIYNAYKIFDVTTATSDGETTGYSYTIDSTSPWYSVVNKATNIFTLTQAGSSTMFYVTVNAGVEDEDVIAVFKNAVSYDADGNAYIGETKLTSAANAAANSAGTAVLTNLDPGYYFITTTLGSVVMIDTADAALEIDEKNDVPVPDKKILEGTTEVEKESSDNTKTVTYVLYAKGVKGAVNLVIHDQMTVDTGITYEFVYSGMQVGLYDVNGNLIQDLGTGTTSTYYTLDTNPGTDAGEDNPCDFHITFTTAAETLFAACDEGAYVMVTIDCSLDAGEAGFSDDEAEIENGEKLSYGNDGDSSWEVVDIYEYGFAVYKYTGNTENDDGTIGTPLANAEFELRNEADELAYFIYNSTTGNYVLEAWGSAPDDGNTYTSTIKTSEDGKAHIEGLSEGTYTLTETKAPDGYNLLGSAITVTIEAGTTDDGTPDPSTFTVTQDGIELGDHTVTVENNSGTILPGTGGMGTTIFYIVGIVLMIGAAAFFVTRKRISKEG